MYLHDQPTQVKDTAAKERIELLKVNDSESTDNYLQLSA